MAAPIERLDIPAESVLREQVARHAAARDWDEAEYVSAAEAIRLVTHPDAPVSTDADYPTWAAALAARTNTPDRANEDGSTTIRMKRACNGCGQLLGDVDNRDVDAHGNLTDVRGECDHCRPLVELEAAGCKTWQLTPRNIGRVDHEIDRLRPWVFTKGYWQDVDGKLQVVGLRIGEYPNHVVAFWGDWIVRHPDGSFTVHKAPAAVS